MLTANERLDIVLIALKGVYEKVHGHRYLVFKSTGSITFRNAEGKDLKNARIPIPNLASGKEGFLVPLDIFKLMNFSENSTVDDLLMILEHLERDGYIISEIFDRERHYKINFSGLYLLENGGYSGKELLQKTERELKEKQLKKADFDVKKMNTIYFIAVIGLVISILNFVSNVTGWHFSEVFVWVANHLKR